MKKLSSHCAAWVLVFASWDALAETAKEYADKCKNDLGFTAADVPTLNCNDGIQFRGSTTQTAVLDYVGAKKIGSSIDVVFACRWMNNGRLVADSHLFEKIPPFKAAASLEMIIHKRTTGQTCFFAAKPGPMTLGGVQHQRRVSTAIVSPLADTTAVNNYWMSPPEIDEELFASEAVNSPEDAPLRCVGCHVAGPYVASLDIASALARYGLLNDGHDTFADFGDTSSGPHYKVVGSNAPGNTTSGSRGFKAWNTLIRDALAPSPCASGCHSVGFGSPALNVLLDNEIRANEELIPSLLSNISQLLSEDEMPPDDPSSDYRWMNSDNPGGTGEYETLAHEQESFPGLYATCQNPTRLEAYVLGSDRKFATDDLPDELRHFNLQDGLKCLNSEQADGTCSDYSTRYLCQVTRMVSPFPQPGPPTPVTSTFWTDWLSVDTPADNGDYERRSDMPSTLCMSSSGALPVQGTPIALQAKTTKVIDGVPFFTRFAYAPNDRLSAFDPAVGLKCKPEDQPGDQPCQDYVVRFSCP